MYFGGEEVVLSGNARRDGARNGPVILGRRVLDGLLEERDTGEIIEWLNEIIDEGALPEEGKRAKELLEMLTEYKPLAKIEEMEEANYNMVDNVLNNGAGEKAQKEENKKEQELPAAKPSLKDRLAEKKELVSDQGKDHESQENLKNSQREM